MLNDEKKSIILIFLSGLTSTKQFFWNCFRRPEGQITLMRNLDLKITTDQLNIENQLYL
jgi:hypothetical protein